MCTVKIQSGNETTELRFLVPTAFIDCLLPAIMAAVPVFASNFLACVQKPPPANEYNPGTRDRCQT